MKHPQSALLAVVFCLSSSTTFAAEDPPVRFTGFNQPVRQVFTITSPERPAREPWPFTENEILIACGEGVLAVVRVGKKYAALNGYTSGQRNVVKVEESTGRRSEIIGTSANNNFRNAGMVKPDASDSAIGYWWGELLEKLRKVPACD
ncbi:hypothetical protein NP284_22510 [Rhodopseudomonas pseudopalustris]|uniref:hypothetical protein n=1 Tax=Rhodopseudomonas pseudopalustris TaxID=1513892 RepID=UPI003F999AAC